MDNKLAIASRELLSTPEKWMTILLLSVCMLIPVVGPMVISGYLILLVSYHLMFQIYDLYLERGGEEIPVADYIYGSVPVTPQGVPPSLPPNMP